MSINLVLPQKRSDGKPVGFITVIDPKGLNCRTAPRGVQASTEKPLVYGAAINVYAVLQVEGATWARLTAAQDLSQNRRQPAIWVAVEDNGVFAEFTAYAE
jgi:hypothetical protein